MNINSDNITTSSDISFSGVLSGQIYYDHDLIGVVDSSLNETVIESTNVYGRPSSSDFTIWSGASYVDMSILNFDYANTCSYSGGACSQVTADNTFDSDFMALLIGDQTASGDMPTSGSKSYRTKTFGFGVYGMSNFLNDEGYVSLLGGCGTNPNYGDCAVLSVFSASAESILTFNFSAGVSTPSDGDAERKQTERSWRRLPSLTAVLMDRESRDRESEKADT